MSDCVQVGEVLRLMRRPVEVAIDVEYQEIGVRAFGRGIFHKEPVSGATLGSKRMFRIEPGDLVISNVFAWEGAVAVASDAEAGMVGSHRFMTFVPIDGRIDAAWAAWFFQSEPGLRLIRRASPGSAGRNRTLAVKRFEALEICLPSAEEQRRVVSQLEQFKSWHSLTASSLGKNDPRMLVSALPLYTDAIVAPVASGHSPVGTMVDFVSDIVYPWDDASPAAAFIGLQHVESHTGLCIGREPLGDAKGRKFRFRPGDVIYGYLRPYQNKVWLADLHGLCSVDQYVLRPRSGVSGAVLAHVLRGQAVLSRAIELTHSLQLPRLRSGLLSALEIPTVTSDRAPALARRLDLTRDLVVDLAKARRNQIGLSNSLIPAALNGAFG